MTVSLLQTHKSEMSRLKISKKDDNTAVRAIIFNSLVSARQCLPSAMPSELQDRHGKKFWRGELRLWDSYLKLGRHEGLSIYCEVNYCWHVQNALPNQIDGQSEAAAPSVPAGPKQGTALKSSRSYLQPKKPGHAHVSEAPPSEMDLPPKPVNKGDL